MSPLSFCHIPCTNLRELLGSNVYNVVILFTITLNCTGIIRNYTLRI